MDISKILTGTALAASAALATPALAITGEFVADHVHPYVGVMVTYDALGPFQSCSGTLISPRKFLTAGHCMDTFGPEYPILLARVYFQQDAGANYQLGGPSNPVTGFPDSCAGHIGSTVPLCVTSHVMHTFDYQAQPYPDSHDVGLLILDHEITSLGYGELPAVGILDKLAISRGTQNPVFTNSGYGSTYWPQAQSGKPITAYFSRLMAQSSLVNLNSAMTAGYTLQLQPNGQGRGGTCHGDSGGPVFLGEYSSKLIVAVTTGGKNTMCRGTDLSYRIDRRQVLDWINSF